MMNDIMDESAFSAGVIFNTAGEYQTYAQWEWKRYFPVFGIKYFYAFRRANPSPVRVFQTSVGVPLSFSSGIWYRSFTSKVLFGYARSGTDGFLPYGFSMGFSALRQRAYRNVGTRLGFAITVKYMAEPETVSELKEIYTSGYLPGIGKNDRLRWHIAYSQRNGRYGFSYTVPTVRGARFSTYGTLKSAGITYHAPLMYPEIGWYRLFYLKRLRYKLFADVALSDSMFMQSYGAQLIGDWNLLGLKFAVPLGIQVAYIRPANQWTVGLVFMDLSF
jgi:hypothetical protein